ncbi:MAG: hypothetical protein ACRD3B_14005, partial [Candidatus Sulfotelmatobacter sp.]
ARSLGPLEKARAFGMTPSVSSDDFKLTYYPSRCPASAQLSDESRAAPAKTFDIPRGWGDGWNLLL